jgi:hypothetical protein
MRSYMLPMNPGSNQAVTAAIDNVATRYAPRDIPRREITVTSFRTQAEQLRDTGAELDVVNRTGFAIFGEMGLQLAGILTAGVVKLVGARLAAWNIPGRLPPGHCSGGAAGKPTVRSRSGAVFGC